MTSLLARAVFIVSALFLSIAAGDSAVAQDRHDRRMYIVNESNSTIVYFHATNKGTKNWGRDLLGQAVIRPGQRWLVNFNDGTGFCQFDFRAVLENGRAVERYGINTCREVSWHVR
jgi:hypothetical protein